MEGQSELLQQQTTLNRYLLYFPHNQNVIPDVHSFTGTEGLSEPWRYSLQLSAGQDLIATAGNDTSMNVVKKFSLAVGEKISLFARKLGIQMIAGAGDITSQAQRGEMHMLSQKDFTLTSTAGKMNGSAREGMQFVCGGGGMPVPAKLNI